MIYSKQAILAKIAVALNLFHFIFLLFLIALLVTAEPNESTTQANLALGAMIYMTIVAFYIFEVIISSISAFKIKYNETFAYIFLLLGIAHIISAALLWGTLYFHIQSLFMIFVGVLYILTAITTLLFRETYKRKPPKTKTGQSFSSIIDDYNENENDLINRE